MNRDSIKTLLYPFEAGELLPPSSGQRVLLINAQPGAVLPSEFEAALSSVQPFRPSYLALQAAASAIMPRIPDEIFDAALVLIGRHRGQNEGWIADAIEHVRPGGRILVGGSADNGAASLRKRLHGLVDLEGHLPKYHGVAFWFRCDEKAVAAVGSLRPAGGMIENRFQTAPGMFSHDRIDPGSRLLADSLPDDCSGVAADFGAGWGYLAAALASRPKPPRAIDLYEAEFEAIEAAKINLAKPESLRAIEYGFFWHDLVGEKVAKRYDLIVMNPPFHQGRAAEPSIGQAKIKVAAGALKPRGRLYLVANRGLPYEEVLNANFAQTREITADGAFRVFVATRR